jgi:eukaryotic-like serine/threonine-protein kinase
MSDDALLIKLAGAITDGSAPDWEAAASTASTREHRQLVEELRIFANLAAVHLGLGVAASENAGKVPRDQPTRWGPLEIRGEIGRGHFGTVYLAWDSALERRVALKLLRETGGAAEIIREGRLLARVRHPNVVTVYGVDQYDDAVGLWMEFVDGLTLSRVLATSGILGAREAALIGVDLCGAVAAVHKAGLLHRDIKAQNLIREGSGRIVLMDFGAGEVRADRTSTGAITGTPLYLAPEIFAGAPATIASDIYSMGVLLFHLVTGRYPVEGQTTEQIEAAHTRQDRQQLAPLRPDLLSGFGRVVERALERDPAHRYRSSDDMRQDLTIALRQQSLEVSDVAVMTIEAPRPPLIGRHTQNARAYHAYLKGRFYWTRRYHGGLMAAYQHFKEAIDEDAGYGLAYAGLADAYAFMGIYATQRPRSAFAAATAAVSRALALDPDLPEAHTSLAFIRLAGDWDLPAAAREFTRALELDPRQAVTRIYYSWLLVLQGDVPGALIQVTTAQETDPLSPLINAGAGHTLYLARRYADAIVECEKALEIDPNFILAIHVTGMCRALQGQLDEAIELAQRAVTIAGRAPFYLGVLGHYYARAGSSDAVRAILEELERTAEQRYVPPHCMTFIYAASNDLDRAFEWQAKAENDGASPFYYVSPLIENLHADPRHLEQMGRMGWKA